MTFFVKNNLFLATTHPKIRTFAAELRQNYEFLK